MSISIPSPHMISDLTSVLRRRGLEPKRMGDPSRTLYPQDTFRSIREAHDDLTYREYFPGEFISHYLQRFGKGSFRKLVRRLLRDGRQFVDVEELEAIAGGSTADYLTYLERTLLLERQGSQVRLTRDINDIGTSLEHYVAQICERDLRGAAEWGVRLENLPRSGGDFDVLAWLEPSLMYVECKSARPREVDNTEIREFLQRSLELAPDLAVLLIDTDDDLTPFVMDRINPIIRHALKISDKTYQPIQHQIAYPRVFHGFLRVYVINTNSSILGQLRKCLQHYYANVKGVSHWAFDETPNFTGHSVRDD